MQALCQRGCTTLRSLLLTALRHGGEHSSGKPVTHMFPAATLVLASLCLPWRLPYLHFTLAAACTNIGCPSLWSGPPAWKGCRPILTAARGRHPPPATTIPWQVPHQRLPGHPARPSLAASFRFLLWTSNVLVMLWTAKYIGNKVPAQWRIVVLKGKPLIVELGPVPVQARTAPTWRAWAGWTSDRGRRCAASSWCRRGQSGRTCA